MNATQALGEVVRTPGAALTAVLAIVYGVGIAVLGEWLGEAGRAWWLLVGAAVVGLVFLVGMVIPFFRRLGG